MIRKSWFIILAILLLLPFHGLAEEIQLSVSQPVRGFSENAITLNAPAAGRVSITVEDPYNVRRSWEMDVPAGETQIAWDGLGYNQEPLATGTYTLKASFKTEKGEMLTGATEVTVRACRNALLFALPRTETYYLGEKNQWLVQMRLPQADGTIVAEFRREDALDTVAATIKRRSASAGMVNYKWNGKLNGKDAEPGAYRVRFWEKGNPDYVHEVRLEVKEGKRPEGTIALTGPVMPTREMSDAEIWEMMQKPSVVADLKEQTDHLKLYSQKGKGDMLGTVHGQSQALEVMKLEDGYAFVGAWNHERGDYVEGWVKADSLTVAYPNSRYGLLIDKQNQTLTVYEEGVALDTFPISTGLVAEDRLIRETAAGSFLTVDRISNFQDGDGYTYEYAIRYDGGNLIHQMGYRKIGKYKNFSDHSALMGLKASHGCIRVSNQPSAKAGITAYWLHTHLPYGTRVIIWDDPEQRALQVAAVTGEPLPMSAPTQPSPPAEGEAEITLTLGGDVVLGTRETWWNREDALPSFLNREGMAYPFQNLRALFETDDMTFVNLEGVLKTDAKGEKKNKAYRFRGLPEWTEALHLASIEQVSIANNHTIDYGDGGQLATRQALETAGIAYSGFEHNYVWEKDGWKIGFGGCRETVYREDPTVVYRDIRELKEAGCHVILYTCHWGKEYDPNHNELQREIAAHAAAAGADIVLGGHPHVVQGVDTIGDTVVLYSLGNLMFGGTIEMTTFDAMLAQVKLRFDKNGYTGCTVELVPVLTSSQAAEEINDYCPVLAEGEDAARILKQVQADTPFELMGEMYFASGR